MKLEVLYEDNHLIAVIKPTGMPVQGDISGDDCLMDEVKKYLKEKYNKPGQVFLGLLHRLDRPVGGIVLFAKTSKGASRLSEQIRNHKFKKTYFAILAGNLKEKSGILKDYLIKDEEKNMSFVVAKNTSKCQEAELSYEVLAQQNDKTLVKINLKTGRHHQIRVQFSHLGHPLLGDVKYGAEKPLVNGQIALFAGALSFTTATGEKTINLEAELPDYFSL